MDSLLDNRSILLVGNGGSLKDSGLGSKIDQFDEVIRINEGKTIGWEEDAGTRFTIWTTYDPVKKFYKYFKGYKNRGYNDNEISWMLKDVKEIWYIHPHGNVNHRYPQLDRYLQYDYKIRKGTPELVTYMKKITPHSTTGFMLINLLSLLYNKFYIIGFDFMGLFDSPSHHYFTDRELDRSGVHRWNIEFNYTKDLIKQGKIEILTKDTIIEKSKYICDSNIYLK